jgi:hypothetical protein
VLKINPFLPHLQFLRPMDMAIGPDGALYLLEWGTSFRGGNSDSQLVRIDFLGNSSRPAGDYNRDGTVNAADYTTWRDSLGSTTNLAADGSDNGVVDDADYGVWKRAIAGMASSSGPPDVNALPSSKGIETRRAESALGKGLAEGLWESMPDWSLAAGIPTSRRIPPLARHSLGPLSPVDIRAQDQALLTVLRPESLERTSAPVTELDVSHGRKQSIRWPLLCDLLFEGPAFTFVDLPTNDLVYDPHSDLLYASVPSVAGAASRQYHYSDPPE